MVPGECNELDDILQDLQLCKLYVTMLQRHPTRNISYFLYATLSENAIDAQNKPDDFEQANKYPRITFEASRRNPFNEVSHE